MEEPNQELNQEPKPKSKPKYTNGSYRTENDVNTDAFIKLLSDETGFTQKDCLTFLKAFIKVFARIIISGKRLVIVGFLSCYMEPQKGGLHYDGIGYKYDLLIPLDKIHFKLSRYFRYLVKKHRDMEESREYYLPSLKEKAIKNEEEFEEFKKKFESEKNIGK